MTIAGQRIALCGAGHSSLPRLRVPAAVHQQLTRTFLASPQVPFDDASRFVFFSDCHRGDNGPTDAFAPNAKLFHQVLTHYQDQGFTYVEVGDGDELWLNRRFSDVERAHGPIFDLLHKLDRRGRLYLLKGNHDVAGPKHDLKDKGGLPVHESLVLWHTRTGREILVAHGHQADFCNDPDFAVSRFFVRHVWRRLLELGFGTAPLWSRAAGTRSWLETQILCRLRAHKVKLERRIIAWLQECRKTVICGHTHLAYFAPGGTPPYFNAGSCVVPGQITGLEIENGLISMVKWSAPPREPGDNGSKLVARRELTAPPRRLAYLHQFF